MTGSFTCVVIFLAKSYFSEILVRMKYSQTSTPAPRPGPRPGLPRHPGFDRGPVKFWSPGPGDRGPAPGCGGFTGVSRGPAGFSPGPGTRLWVVYRGVPGPGLSAVQGYLAQDESTTLRHLHPEDSHARPFEPQSQVIFSQCSSTFGDKCPQNGSKNDPGITLEGPSVVGVDHKSIINGAVI